MRPKAPCRCRIVRGRRSGMLTVLIPLRDRKVIVRCKCGEVKTIDARNLSKTQSCGCSTGRLISERLTRHGHGRRGRRSPTFKRFLGMHERCEQPSNEHYKHYGAKGIKVAARWSGRQGFVHFLEDLGKLPSPRHTLSRKRDVGDYKPGNVSWELPEHQYKQARLKRERLKKAV